MFQMLQKPKKKEKGHSDFSAQAEMPQKAKNDNVFPAARIVSSNIWGSESETDNGFALNGFYSYSNNFNVIQRAFDDIEEKEYTDQGVFGVLIKIIEKHPELQDFISKNKISARNIHEYYKSKLNERGQRRSLNACTERQMAEQLTVGELGRDMISFFLARKKENSNPQDARPIQRIMRECWYFHATERANVENIYSRGLSPWVGGAGKGISTMGIARRDMQQQYNQWSRGFAFITPDVREANGYKEKLDDGVILDIFVGPALRQHLYIDPDSKGLRCDREIYAVGDGDKLNPTAVGFLSILAEQEGDSVTTEEVQEIYRSLR